MKGRRIKDTSRVREKESNVVLGSISENHSSLSHYIGKIGLEKAVPTVTGTVAVVRVPMNLATSLTRCQMQSRDPGADHVVGDASINCIP